ncbi:DNA-binding response regulator [Hahella sp. CCB-MM4]|uniref:response regulator transcription factor n=1 Tax=Hahella sp. (strain CCB-MM4) TaxID=1926491 RepID=UPI000B9AEED3|nr:response regulator transcription factor [Hahella sp. CCB-MM4]OZG70201.1 DNA-binding response regulator [Hahella sp. CCB-MM4]
MHILVIEDAEILRQSLETGLTDAGHQVDSVADGKEGLMRALNYQYDLILLDIMLPGMDGFQILSKIREKDSDLLVLMLTARDAVEDRVQGLTHGADDYLVKPFHFSELLARIETLFRRRFGLKQNSITVGHITLDTNTKSVKSQNAPLNLPPREYALLEYLMLHRDRVVSRSELEEHIYDEYIDPMSNVVNSAVSTLRKLIDLPGQPSLIKTRRGFGYQMSES